MLRIVSPISWRLLRVTFHSIFANITHLPEFQIFVFDDRDNVIRWVFAGFADTMLLFFERAAAKGKMLKVSAIRAYSFRHLLYWCSLKRILNFLAQSWQFFSTPPLNIWLASAKYKVHYYKIRIYWVITFIKTSALSKISNKNDQSYKEKIIFS